jgi:hypothetical protein
MNNAEEELRHEIQRVDRLQQEIQRRIRGLEIELSGQGMARNSGRYAERRDALERQRQDYLNITFARAGLDFRLAQIRPQQAARPLPEVIANIFANYPRLPAALPPAPRLPPSPPVMRRPYTRNHPPPLQPNVNRPITRKYNGRRC